MKIYETLLLFALVCALAAFFVMWAKWEEEKLKTKEERKCYDAMLRLHNATAEAAQSIDDHQYYALNYLQSVIDEKSRKADELQDRLSALLCPTNNHVWVDGFCTKCGRVKDD